MIGPRAARLERAVSVALWCGLLVDAFVGGLALFAQPLVPLLLDVPVRDPALTTITGGLLAVAAVVYAFPLRDRDRYRPLLWLCALDQSLGVALPLMEIVRGHLPPTLKTLGPMPFQAVLIALYVAGALRPGVKRSATPFIQ